MHKTHIARTEYLGIFSTISLCICFLTQAALASSVTYTYDAQHRLIAATYDNGTRISYSYDIRGNLLQRTTTGPDINSYEDAEDGSTSGWTVYDADPTGATITNIHDESRDSSVIEFTGSGTANGYRLRNADGSNWSDTNFPVLEWSMQYSENFTVYIAVQTLNGFRYLYYTPSASDNLGDGTYVHHGLGTTLKDGTWHTLIRDLEYDLKDAQPDNELISINAFLIRGSGKVDDIRTLRQIPETLDSDSDGITDLNEINTYSTNPYKADTDNDGLNDGDELNYWTTNWNADPDGDSLPNILDPDADNDGLADGIEVKEGADPLDPLAYPLSITYEDGEDISTSGWTVYDTDPDGATITNIYDDASNSQVIEFSGTGTSNGYRLRNDDNANWNDTNFKILEWSFRYSENFTIYVAVQTLNGFRYIYYTPVETDKLGDTTYIHHGLGSNLKDDNWHTIVRDLEYDLKEAQPDNELISIDAFLIRGSGRVDNIRTMLQIPEEQDSDNDNLTDLNEINLYGTHPYHADSDIDHLPDGNEAAFWGTEWNADLDGDMLINILDKDSDNDGFADGLESAAGTDAADAASMPVSLIYEDAEDSTTSGWQIYDNDPEGATITNIFDDIRNSNVIEFSGSGTANGYRLRYDDNSNWNDSTFKNIEWSMRYSDYFTIYIATQTLNGFRYLYYTASNTDNLGDATYIHHGLGSAVKDNTWHTFTRNLENDLKEAQPDNELLSIDAFLIRGNGRVDDIKTVD
jgi:YD repeat-containing protein